MNLRTPAAYLVSLILLCIFFWSEMVFLNKIPFFRDIILQFYPWQVFADNSISAGVLPLWNNFSGCGSPFIANLQSAVFYPLKLIFYTLPFVLAVKIYIISHFVLAGFFMFYLARDFKISDKAAFFAALVFTFNGYMVSRVEFFSVLSSSVWLPLIILFLKKLIETGKFKYFALSSLALSMPVFAGSVQIYFYNILIAFAFVIWYSWLCKKKWWSNTVLFGSAIVISLLLSSVQLLPFIEFVMNSVRQSGMSYSAASNWSLHPVYLINFLTPFIWGNPSFSGYFGSVQFWVNCFYCGISSVMLIAAYYTVKLTRKFKNDRSVAVITFFSFVLIFFMVISLGKYGLLHRVLYELVFPFRMIRYPGVAIYGVVFCLALISGLIVEKLPLIGKMKGAPRKIYLTGSFICLLLLSVFSYFNYFSIKIDAARLGVINNSILISIFMVGISALLIYYFTVKRLSKPALLTALSLILFFDLFVNSSGIIPLMKPETLLAESKIVEYLKADSSDYRVDIEPVTKNTFCNLFQNEKRHFDRHTYKKYIQTVKSIFHENYGIMCGVESSEIYDPMHILRQDKYFAYLMGQKAARDSSLIDLANIKYLLSGFEVREKGFIKREEADGIKIYENKNVLPRTFVVYNAENASDSNDAFLKISKKEFLPSETAVVEGENIGFLENTGNKSTPAGALYVSANKVLINFNAVTPGLLVLLDSYYPGWEVSIDGVPGKILRTNYLFRGVLVPAGTHTAEFVYRPVYFRAGAAISLSVIAFLLLAFVWLWAKKIYR